MKEKIVLVGGGGHCRAVIDVLEEQAIYDIAGIVDVKEKVGSTVAGYPIIATDDDLPNLITDFKNYCIALGHIKSNKTRKNIFAELKNLGAIFPVVKSPRAYVSKSAVIKEGTVVMHFCVVNANATIGSCCIANTGCIIEHDVTIGDHCHVGPAAILNGGCMIECDCFVGSNTVIIPGITVKRNSLIGAGSVVISDLAENGLYAGNPAALKKTNND